MVRRITSIVIACLIILNSFGYLLTYLQLKKFYKKVISEKKLNNIPENELELIIIPKVDLYETITFIEEDEFIYNNKLYDIFNTTETESEIYYWCLYDEDETKLDLAFLEIQLSTEEENSLFNIFNNLNNIISAAIFLNSIYNNSLPFSPFYFKQNVSHYTHYQEIPTPPPEYIS